MKKVVVGMSGGVDSSVSAYLLKNEGFDVIGITMNVWDSNENNNQAIKDAKKVCEFLNIPHYVLDFKDVFKKNVIDYFISSYINGMTPNPCVVCNKKVKWEALYSKAVEMGASYIATGHYSKIVKTKDNRLAIKNADSIKDQSYALCMLSQDQLKNSIFPLGNYSKNEVREIASKLGLFVSQKPDSQDICFITGGDYKKFILNSTNISNKPGDFIDTKGNVLGRHNGIINYTVGQRKGLNISHKYSLYVLKIDTYNNTIVLGSRDETYVESVIFDSINYMGWEKIKDKTVKAKIRYNHKGEEGKVRSLEDGKLEFIFKNKVSSPAKGQMLVVYDEGYIALSGVIK